MRKRAQVGPGYTKVDYKPDEHVDGYASTGDCNYKGQCYSTECRRTHKPNHDGGCHHGC